MKNIKYFFLSSLILLFTSGIYAQSVIYVDGSASTSGNGTSWSNPYQNLQTAIDSAQTGDTIWVKRGTYKPTKTLSGTTPSNQRPKTFILKSDISIYGSFKGTESSLSQRVLSTADSNLTILSGDFGTVSDSSDNAYHVMVGTSIDNVVLNGLSFRYGNADDTTSENVGFRTINRGYGGGLFLDTASSVILNYVEFKNNNAIEGGAGLNIESSLLIDIENALFTRNIIDARNITGGTNDGGAGMRSNNTNALITNGSFRNNECYDCQGGGAMRNNNSNTVVDSCNFIKNYVNGKDGGGAVYNYYSDPTFTTVSFDTNTTLQEAGAVYSDNSNPTFKDVIFSFNSGGSGGGGAVENDAGTATFNNVIFKNNSSQGDGGAIQNWKSDIDLTDVVFDNNHADGNGGAIVNYNNCNANMNRVTFKNNSSNKSGGALYNLRESEAVITNTLFYGNHADNRGGAICIEKYMSGSTPLGSSVILTNVTITKNSADTIGGGGYDDGSGNSKLRNSIIYGNTAPSSEDVFAPTSMIATSVSHSIIGNERFTSGMATPTAFSHIHFKDSVNNDFRLDTLSPAVDNGDSSFYDAANVPNLSGITTDLRGADRIMGYNVDIGANELCGNIVTVVSIISQTQTVNTVTFTATPTPNSSGYNLNYKWYVNNTLVPGVTGNQYVATAGVDVFNNDWVTVGTYSSDPCTRSGYQDSLQVIITGIEKNTKAENHFNLYPNPNNGTFTLDYQPEGAVSSFTINDITGREIYREEGQSNTAERAFNLDLSNGLYFFSITNENGEKETQKFIVQ